MCNEKSVDQKYWISTSRGQILLFQHAVKTIKKTFFRRNVFARMLSFYFYEHFKILNLKTLFLRANVGKSNLSSKYPLRHNRIDKMHYLDTIGAALKQCWCVVIKTKVQKVVTFALIFHTFALIFHTFGFALIFHTFRRAW